MNKNRNDVYRGYYNPETIAKFRDALNNAKKIVTDPNFSGKVKISAGNTKMGAVPSVSMLPFLTCPARCAETCGPDCYAAKLANLREMFVMHGHIIQRSQCSDLKFIGLE